MMVAARGDEATSQQSTCVVNLIERYRSALLGHVTRMLGCAHDAEDVVQETCVRLMRARDFWRGERPVRAMLFKIARNLALDELRRRRARAYHAHLPYDTVSLVSDADQPDEIVEQQANMQALEYALKALPARHREVFSLHVQGQMSYRAISKHLGISTKTVERDICGVREFCQGRLSAPRSIAHHHCDMGAPAQVDEWRQ
jgi:RNA polymerase sigma-70 factor (ECF subfamily)